MKQKHLKLPILPVCMIGFMLLCRSSPAFSTQWTAGIIRPVSRTLAHFSARIPFPLAEAGAVVLLIGAVLFFLLSAGIGLRKRSLKPVKRALLNILRLVIFLLAALLLLWYPTYWGSGEALSYPASTAQAEALCIRLIDRLNASDLRFSDQSSILSQAADAVSSRFGVMLPRSAVKSALFPAWMDAMQIAGIYSPWTGEAIVDGSAAPAALAFTACHELIHLLGVADEGMANILAWQACADYGGELSVSADLWALRYGMTILHTSDQSAWKACTERMSAELTRTFGSMNGFAPLNNRQSSMWSGAILAAGLQQPTRDYDALVGWLIASDH